MFMKKGTYSTPADLMGHLEKLRNVYAYICFTQNRNFGKG